MTDSIQLRVFVKCFHCGRKEDFDRLHDWLRNVSKKQADGAWLQTQVCPDCIHKEGWYNRLRHLSQTRGWRLGRITQYFEPWLSACGRCHTTWDFVEGHVTDYSLGSGCFPLCEQCWGELTPHERLPYYRALFDRWEKPNDKWRDIERAVLEGR